MSVRVNRDLEHGQNTDNESVCHHPQRAEIEAAHVVGVTFREIGKRFDRSKTTIQEHIKLHVPAAAQKALDAANDREVEAGDAILEEVNRLKDDAKRLQVKAEKDHDIRAALIAIDKLTRLAGAPGSAHG